MADTLIKKRTLLSKLRRYAEMNVMVYAPELFAEAADEIERLRKYLAEIADDLESAEDTDIIVFLPLRIREFLIRNGP